MAGKKDHEKKHGKLKEVSEGSGDDLVIDDPPVQPPAPKKPKKSELEKVIGLMPEIKIMINEVTRGLMPQIEPFLNGKFEQNTKEFEIWMICEELKKEIRIFELDQKEKAELNKEDNRTETQYKIENFQTVDKQRERLEASIMALVGSETKEWATVADKVVEVYKLAAGLGFTIWGKNSKKESVLRFSSSGPDWQGPPMQELTYQLLNRTTGLDWNLVKDAHQLIQQTRGDLGRIREEFPKTVGMEFANILGSSLPDFVVQWRGLLSDVEEHKNALKVIGEAEKPEVKLRIFAPQIRLIKTLKISLLSKIISK